MEKIVLLLCFTRVFVDVFGFGPSFDVSPTNITVKEGEEAVMPCSVDNLGEHKVVWADQWSTLLTLDERRIIADPRISIERPYTKDWDLHIKKAMYKDRGQYTCHINTNPIKTNTVMLIVLVPSQIINELSSRDKTVREGETVTLVCNATGVPIPDVTWYKLPNEGTKTKERLDLDPGSYTLIDSCAYILQQTGIGTSGEVLRIRNVSRYCDGTYECVAYNNVDPPVTRQNKVFVEFAPEVSLPTKRMSQFIGKETILDCEITANPYAIIYWKKGNNDVDLFNKDKYQVELFSDSEVSTRKTLSLRVKNLSQEDFGYYTCYAENKIGNDQETLVLYEYSIHHKPKSTTKGPIYIEPTPNITNIPTGSGTKSVHPRLKYWTERPGSQDERKDQRKPETDVETRTVSRASKCSGTFLKLCLFSALHVFIVSLSFRI